jgi:predicted PurR-regulated permease PerM
MDALVLGLIATIFEAFPFVGPLLSAVVRILVASDHRFRCKMGHLFRSKPDQAFRCKVGH